MLAFLVGKIRAMSRKKFPSSVKKLVERFGILDCETGKLENWQNGELEKLQTGELEKLQNGKVVNVRTGFSRKPENPTLRVFLAELIALEKTLASAVNSHGKARHAIAYTFPRWPAHLHAIFERKGAKEKFADERAELKWFLDLHRPRTIVDNCLEPHKGMLKPRVRKFPWPVITGIDLLEVYPVMTTDKHKKAERERLIALAKDLRQTKAQVQSIFKARGEKAPSQIRDEAKALIENKALSAFSEIIALRKETADKEVLRNIPGWGDKKELKEISRGSKDKRRSDKFLLHTEVNLANATHKHVGFFDPKKVDAKLDEKFGNENWIPNSITGITKGEKNVDWSTAGTTTPIPKKRFRRHVVKIKKLDGTETEYTIHEIRRLQSRPDLEKEAGFKLWDMQKYFKLEDQRQWYPEECSYESGPTCDRYPTHGIGCKTKYFKVVFIAPKCQMPKQVWFKDVYADNEREAIKLFKANKFKADIQHIEYKPTYLNKDSKTPCS